MGGKKLSIDYEKQIEADRAIYDQVKAKTLEDSKAKHEESVELKHRLSRLVPVYEKFRGQLRERRRDEFDKRRRDAERELEKQINLRKKEYRERKLREKRDKERQEGLEKAALQQRREEEALARRKA